LVANLDNSEELEVRYHVDDPDEIRRLLDEGRARLAVIIPAGFARDLNEARTSVPMQVIADATNTMAASVALNAASGVLGRFSADLASSWGVVVPEFIDFRTNVRFNPTMDLRPHSIPAQLGFITYQVTLAVASLGLARERELGTLEQLMVTPLRRLELTVGKGVPAMAIGALNFGLMWIISLTVFDVPMNGSPLLLAGLALLFIATEVGWGLAISAISRTQQQAILFVFIQAMVDMAFSGFLVPVKNMPSWLQIISRVVPLQHFLTLIRSIMLRGAGLAQLWPHAVAMFALCVIMGAVAWRTVARRLE
jgi:ABC-2 type transport system permease protein